MPLPLFSLKPPVCLSPTDKNTISTQIPELSLRLHDAVMTAPYLQDLSVGVCANVYVESAGKVMLLYRSLFVFLLLQPHQYSRLERIMDAFTFVTIFSSSCRPLICQHLVTRSWTAYCSSYTAISKTNITSFKMLVWQLLLCYNSKISQMLNSSKVQTSSTCTSLLLLSPS